jgi:hypothetical protein
MNVGVADALADTGARKHGAMTDRWLAALCLGALVVYGAWTAYVVRTNRPVDYFVYLIGADALARGVNIYDAPRATYDQLAAQRGITNYEGGFQYPLWMALLLRPLLQLPLQIGAALWVFGSGAAALGAAFVLALGTRSAWKRRLIVLAAIGFVPNLTTMNAGQVNAYILLCTALALHFWRRQSDQRAGLLLAFGLWLKPLAAPLAGLAAWRARPRVLIGLVLASVTIAIVTTLVYGQELALAQLRGSAGLLSMLGFAHPANSNLNGLFSRWFTANEFAPPLLLAPGLAAAAYALSASLLGLGALALLWPPGNTSRPAGLEFSLIVVTTHLVVPLTWYHHLSMIFIAFAVLILRWPEPGRLTASALALAVAYFLLAVHGLLWHFFVGHTLLLDFATWSELIVWCLLALEIRRDSSSQATMQALRKTAQAAKPL